MKTFFYAYFQRKTTIAKGVVRATQHHMLRNLSHFSDLNLVFFSVKAYKGDTGRFKVHHSCNFEKNEKFKIFIITKQMHALRDISD